MLIGTATQFTTTAAGLVVGLIESHLLAAAPAAAVLLGAQVGAAAAPSVLGLASTAREGLLLVTIGVIWLSLAVDRRGKALGKVILGCGLLFYGLHLLRIGFEPLVADPEIMPYIDRFQADSWRACWCAWPPACCCRRCCKARRRVRAGAGVGPGHRPPGSAERPVHPGRHRAGRLDRHRGGGLALRPEPRKLARLYFLIALAGTVLLATTVDLWAFIADKLVSGQPGEVAYGKKVLLPHIGRHLATAFVLSQLVVAALLGAALPLFVKLAARLTPGPSSRHL